MGTGLGVHLHSSLWAVWPFWGWPGILELAYTDMFEQLMG